MFSIVPPPNLLMEARTSTKDRPGRPFSFDVTKLYSSLSLGCDKKKQDMGRILPNGILRVCRVYFGDMTGTAEEGQP